MTKIPEYCLNNPCCEIYDSYYNEMTEEWLEKKCQDKDCHFCKSRPDKHPIDCECKEEECG